MTSDEQIQRAIAAYLADEERIAALRAAGVVVIEPPEEDIFDVLEREAREAALKLNEA